MVGIQLGVIIFLVFILALIYHDEFKKKMLGRKSAKLDRFWKDGKERRGSIRIDTAVNVLYEVTSRSKPLKKSSISKNISEGGINLALSEKLLPGTTLFLQLNLPQEHRPVFAQGKVVWVREISEKFNKQEEERYFATGIQFIQVKPADATALRSFIDQKIKTVAE